MHYLTPPWSNAWEAGHNTSACGAPLRELDARDAMDPTLREAVLQMLWCCSSSAMTLYIHHAQTDLDVWAGVGGTLAYLGRPALALSPATLWPRGRQDVRMSGRPGPRTEIQDPRKSQPGMPVSQGEPSQPSMLSTPTAATFVVLHRVARRFVHLVPAWRCRAYCVLHL